MKVEVYIRDRAGTWLNVEPTWTVAQLKAAACELLHLSEAEFIIWDYFHVEKYKCLEEDLDLSLDDAKVLENQAVLLELKKGLHVLFSSKEDHGELLDLIVTKLPAHERSAAAGSCKALRAAVRDVRASLHLSKAADISSVAESVGQGHYHRVASLHIEDEAATSPDLPTLVALLAPKLQQLISSGSSPCIIPCLATLVSYHTLSRLSLSLPSLQPASQGPLLVRVLSQLTSMTGLKLDIKELPAPLTSTISPLASLPELSQLFLGGRVELGSLPPGLTALTLADRAASALPHVSTCTALQRLGFDSAILPDQHETSHDLWRTLAPLMALTALEGTIQSWEHDEFGSDHWAEVGSAAADSLVVAQRLKRLCLGDASSPGMLDGVEIAWFVGPCGDLSVLTNLEALWVQFSTSAGIPQTPPPRLREMRVNVYDGDETSDLRGYTALTSLTLELPDEYPMLPLLPREELQELVVVTHEDVDGQLGNLDFLPKLRRFTLYGREVKAAVMAAVFSLGPALEEVHMYVEDPKATEEVAAEALEPKRHKPVVKLFQLDAVETTPLVVVML